MLFPRLGILMANEAATMEGVAEQISFGVIAANEYSTASKDNWVQLSPFGTFPNAQGIQKVEPADARAIANEFNSPTSVGVRALGLPFYVGHPDHPAFKQQYKDSSAKGRIKAIQCREDASCGQCKAFVNQMDTEPCPNHGLFGNVKWNDEGKQLIANQSFHGHSVNWRLRKVGAEWHPFSLKSVGFTNEPCIPVAPITTANEKLPMSKPSSLMDYVNKCLGTKYATNEEAETGMQDFANSKRKLEDDHTALKGSFDALAQKHAALAADHTDTMNKLSDITKKFGANELVMTALEAITTAGFTVPAEAVVVTLANELVSTKTSTATELQAVNEKLTTATGEVTKLTGERDAAVSNFANERKTRTTDLLGMLVAGGFLTDAERTKKLETFGDFANEAAFVSEYAALLTLKPKLNVRSQLGNLGVPSAKIQDEHSRSQAVITLVNEVMDKDSISYMAAFEKVKTDPKNSALFANMKQPVAPKREAKKK